MAVGNRVYLKRPMVSDELLNEYQGIPAANVADCMGRLSALHPRVSLKSSPKQPVTVGRALTVKTRGGDNLMIHKALNMAQPAMLLWCPMTVARNIGRSWVKSCWAMRFINKLRAS